MSAHALSQDRDILNRLFAETDKQFETASLLIESKLLTYSELGAALADTQLKAGWECYQSSITLLNQTDSPLNVSGDHGLLLNAEYLTDQSTSIELRHVGDSKWRLTSFQLQKESTTEAPAIACLRQTEPSALRVAELSGTKIPEQALYQQYWTFYQGPSLTPQLKHSYSVFAGFKGGDRRDR
jgi:hypothetical protein